MLDERERIVRPSYKTIEIVYSKPFQPNKSCVFFHTGLANRFVVFRYISSTPPTNQIYFEAGKSTKVISRRTSAGEITSAVALYGDDEYQVADLIEICPDTINSLLIVGHNPLVSRLVSRLSGSDGFGWFATSEAVWLPV